MMTDVQKGAIAADRLALTRPPGGQNAQHWVPVHCARVVLHPDLAGAPGCVLSLIPPAGKGHTVTTWHMLRFVHRGAWRCQVVRFAGQETGCAARTWEAVPELQRQQRSDAGAEAVAARHQLPPLPLDPPLHDGGRILAPLMALQFAIPVADLMTATHTFTNRRLPVVTTAISPSVALAPSGLQQHSHSQVRHVMTVQMQHRMTHLAFFWPWPALPGPCTSPELGVLLFALPALSASALPVSTSRGPAGLTLPPPPVLLPPSPPDALLGRPDTLLHRPARPLATLCAAWSASNPAEHTAARSAKLKCILALHTLQTRVLLCTINMFYVSRGEAQVLADSLDAPAKFSS
jgi:hypothetical protein